MSDSKSGSNTQSLNFTMSWGTDGLHVAPATCGHCRRKQTDHVGPELKCPFAPTSFLRMWWAT